MCILFSPQVPSSHREQDFTEQTTTAERKRKKKNTEEKEGVEAEDNVKSLSTPKLKKRKVQDGERDSVAANSLPPAKVKKQKQKRKHKKVSSSETAAKLSSARLKSYGL